MLHNGNRVFGHARSEESIKLLREHLVKHHTDKDGDSLFCRFDELMLRVQDMEATWKQRGTAICGQPVKSRH